MTRLAALLHEQAIGCWYDSHHVRYCEPDYEHHRKHAARLIAQGVRVGDDRLRAAVTDHLRAVDLEAKRRDDMTRVQFRFPDLHEAEVAWKAAETLVRDTLAALRAALAAEPAPPADGCRHCIQQGHTTEWHEAHYAYEADGREEQG